MNNETMPTKYKIETREEAEYYRPDLLSKEEYRSLGEVI